MVKEIQCVGGKIALVDDEDYPLLSRHTWNLSGYEPNQYAITKVPTTAGQEKNVYMHNLILGFAVHVDHADRNTFNNQKSNLRAATWQLNQWNKGKPKSGRHGLPTSQYKGVSYKPIRGHAAKKLTPTN